jgi:hypothetical protein
MAKANSTWTVLPHRPIEKLEDNLWRVEGDLPGMPLKRVMTLARRSDGGVVIHNGIALEESAMREIEAWGKPAVLVVPNGYHRLDAMVFKQRYPALKVLCPRGATKAVAEVVAPDGTYDDLPHDENVRLEHLAGTAEREGVMIVRSGGRTSLVFNDAIFNMPHKSGFSGFVMRYLTDSSGGPKVTRIGRMFVMKEAPALRAHFERLATPDLARIIVSHEDVINDKPADTLRAIAATL